MIAKLSGIMDSAGQDYLILDVGGVGYQVFASGRTLSRVQKGEPVSLLIDTHVREDHIHLYGFMDKAEQEWFRLLTSVQGVGAKVGMAILSVCPVDRLGFAIAAGDAAFVRQADGVGPKLATRIVTELKDKAAKIDLTLPTKTAGKSSKLVEQEPPPANIENDAVSALVNLGYGRADAYSAVLQARQKANDNDDLQVLIRLALKELAS
ncbi:MAG: Holliday junction branch migration protein RuvA [Alphaproteobacteria bacterium]|nr:Holliday junction branch migration protein RuvA [Alphaproteobacteria bacterium]